MLRESSYDFMVHLGIIFSSVYFLERHSCSCESSATILLRIFSTSLSIYLLALPHPSDNLDTTI